MLGTAGCMGGVFVFVCGGGSGVCAQGRRTEHIAAQGETSPSRRGMWREMVVIGRNAGVGQGIVRQFLNAWRLCGRTGRWLFLSSRAEMGSSEQG